MKNEKISSRLTIVLVTGLLMLASCKKEKEVTPEPEVEDTEQSSATDFAISETITGDIESMGSDGSENSNSTIFRTAGENSTEGIMAATCASVITSTVTPKTFTIDFGTTGCTGTDGRVRSGKLVYDFSGSTLGATRYRNPGFSMNVSSINYVVDGYTVNITNKTISNTTPASLPNGTNLTWSVSANISILKPGGGTITWLCNRTKELTNTSDVNCYSGQANPIKWSKAIVKINGTATGVNTSGETYSSTATNLVRDFNCSPSVLYPHKHPFISGTILYTPGSRKARLIDYGTGACDLAGTITINNKSYAFVLQ